MRKALHSLRYPLFILAMFLCFSLLTDRLADNQREERRAKLEEACRFAAVDCYASEGFYPPDLAALAEYGAFSTESAEEDGYAFFYHAVADNLMPDITVVDLHES